MPPRTVDPGRRRAELAEAVWRVVRRDGLDAATVRAVAREAGTSMGALRHWLPSQDELVRAALELIGDRAAERVTRVDRSGPPRAVAEALLSEVLPLDEDRLIEAQVWYALTARSLVAPTLAALRDQVYDALRGLCAEVVAALLPPGSSEATRELEVERLYGVIDGLTVHAVLRPDAVPPHLVQAVLRAHLDAISRPGAPAGDC